MIKCVNTNSLQRANTGEELLDQTIHEDFTGLELNLDQNLELFPEIKNENLSTIYQKAQVKNMEILSVTTCSHDLFSLCAENETTRTAARDYFTNLIDCAAPISAITTIPAHQILPLGSIPQGSYELSFYHLFKSLQQLAAHAEKNSIHLALETPGSGFLLSPLELREIIDQVNNPYMGLCLNPHYIKQNADPLDWLNILIPRIMILHLPVEQLSNNLPQKYQQILALLQRKNISLPVVHSITQ